MVNGTMAAFQPTEVPAIMRVKGVTATMRMITGKERIRSTMPFSIRYVVFWGESPCGPVSTRSMATAKPRTSPTAMDAESICSVAHKAGKMTLGRYSNSRVVSKLKNMIPVPVCCSHFPAQFFFAHSRPGVFRRPAWRRQGRVRPEARTNAPPRLRAGHRSRPEYPCRASRPGYSPGPRASRRCKNARCVWRRNS